jgi:4'-phosphopantetheinyl transferase
MRHRYPVLGGRVAMFSRCKSHLRPDSGGIQRTLDRGEVDVWYKTTMTLGHRDIERSLAVLSSAERSQQRRFILERDRRDYGAAHALLRHALSRYAPVSPQSWQFNEDRAGKPILVPHPGAPRLSFNLSHTNGLVACAIAAGQDVGVDVELASRIVDERVGDRFFAAVERDQLRGYTSPRQRSRRFFQLWTLKEAYIKAIGQGLSHPLNTIVFRIKNDESIDFTPPDAVDARCWQFALFTPTDQHCMAVATSREPNQVPVIRLINGGAAFT